MHVQAFGQVRRPFRQVRRRVTPAPAEPPGQEPPVAALGLVRLVLLLAALSMFEIAAVTPLRPRGREPAGFPAAKDDTSPWNGKPRRPWATLPVHRSIFAVDIENSSQRTNTVKEELRQHVYQLVDQALDAAGIDEHSRDPISDLGDGVLVLVHPTDELPKPLLLSRLIPALASLLVAHNGSISPAEQPRVLRLRAVIHAGEVHDDGKGFFGEELDVAFRLLDAPKFKAQLRCGSAPLALVASDDIYRSVIRHGYEGIDSDEFRELVTVTVAGRRRKGWVHFPRAGRFPMAVPGSAAFAC